MKLYKKKTTTRKPRRVARIPRIRSKGSSLKNYNYKFQLPSQVLVGSQSTAGLIQFPALTGPAPFTNSALNIVQSTTGLADFYDVGLSAYFSLNDVKNTLAFSSMYDAWKLNKVKLTIQYLNSAADVNSKGLLPTAYMYWDQDDSTAPTVSSSITSKQGVKVRMFGNKSTTVISTSGRPRPLTMLADGTTASRAGVNTGKSQWIDCNKPDVPHYAVKLWLQDVYLPGGSATQAFRFEWTYDISFRSPILTT